MESLAVGLISFAVMLNVIATTIGGALTAQDLAGDATRANAERAYAVLDSNLTASAEASQGAGYTDVDVTVVNEGSHSYSQYAKWDVIVHYTPAGSGLRAVRLPYSTTLSTNTWTVLQVYLDAEVLATEILEPGVFNPEEEAVFRVRLDPAVELNTTGRVIVVPPEGLPLSAAFDG